MLSFCAAALDPGLQPARLGGLRLALCVRGGVPPGGGGSRLCVQVDFERHHLAVGVSKEADKAASELKHWEWSRHAGDGTMLARGGRRL